MESNRVPSVDHPNALPALGQTTERTKTISLIKKLLSAQKTTIRSELNYCRGQKTTVADRKLLSAQKTTVADKQKTRRGQKTTVRTENYCHGQKTTVRSENYRPLNGQTGSQPVGVQSEVCKASALCGVHTKLLPSAAPCMH